MADKPQPIVDVWNKPFWDACRERRLTVQRCEDTSRTWFPPSPVSPFSPDAAWAWVDCSGKGKVLSWVKFHQKYFSGFADELPYNVAMIELAEGAVLISNVLPQDQDLTVGMDVEVVFENRGDFVVPLFRAADHHG